MSCGHCCGQRRGCNGPTEGCGRRRLSALPRAAVALGRNVAACDGLLWSVALLACSGSCHRPWLRRHRSVAAVGLRSLISIDVRWFWRRPRIVRRRTALLHWRHTRRWPPGRGLCGDAQRRHNSIDAGVRSLVGHAGRKGHREAWRWRGLQLNSCRGN